MCQDQSQAASSRTTATAAQHHEMEECSCSNPQPCHYLTSAAAAHQKLHVLLQQCLMCWRRCHRCQRRVAAQYTGLYRQANKYTCTITSPPTSLPLIAQRTVRLLRWLLNMPHTVPRPGNCS